jgi:hypothetical protein
MARALQGYNQVGYALDYFLAGAVPPPRHKAADRPATVQVPVYFTIDPSAASALKAHGHWRSEDTTRGWWAGPKGPK